MSLLVLAYPSLDDRDWKWIQEIRAEHDKERYQFVDPHFTLVFSVSDWTHERFIQHIGDKTKDAQPVQFILRCAMVVKDSFSDDFNTFLVPEEGFSAILSLHDSLYQGPLSDRLRIEIAYIPHLSVGYSSTAWESKKLAYGINQSKIQIAGKIETLDIVTYTGGSIETIAQIHLE
jgi:hypothetical protein